MLSDSDDAAQENVCIIEESDLEDEPVCTESDSKLPLTSFHAGKVGSTCNLPTTPVSESNANSNEDSSLNSVRKCRKGPLKNRNAFLFQTDLEDEPSVVQCDTVPSETHPLVEEGKRNLNSPNHTSECGES